MLREISPLTKAVRNGRTIQRCQSSFYEIHLLTYGIVDSFHVVELDDTTPANNLVGPEYSPDVSTCWGYTVMTVFVRTEYALFGSVVERIWD
ncbi:hypothetical protein LSAT2_016843 [Lamellibrachia satsuma]|nr:hypothetical protein LSAT2_016843 [Lamellibrachia satsuma]